MLRPLKVGEYQSGCLTTQALNLILPDFCSLRGIGHYLFQFFLAQAQVMDKRKEPMHPAGFWLLLQFVFNFFRCFVPPFWQWPGAVDVLLVHIQAWVVRIERSHQVIAPHSGLTHKLNVSRVNLINVQASVLAAQGILPLAFVTVADNKDDLITAGCVEEDVGHVITTSAVTFVLHQYAEVIQDTQVLLDDVLLGGACIIRSQDMQLLWAFGYLKHELEQSYRGLSGCRGTLQELHRRITTQERLVLIRQQQSLRTHYPPPRICSRRSSSLVFSASRPPDSSILSLNIPRWRPRSSRALSLSAILISRSSPSSPKVLTFTN